MLKAAVLRRHLTDDQRAVMGAMWMKEHWQQGERTDLTSPSRGGEVEAAKVGPAQCILLYPDNGCCCP